MGLVNISAFDNINSYWFNHWQDHLEIVQFINSVVGGLNLPTYVIHPWQESDKDGILERHQKYHDDFNDFAASAGVPVQSTDLGTVEFDDPSSRDPWVYTNYQWHMQVRALLGI